MAAIKLTKDNFNEIVLTGTKPALVEFWAPWCTYCRRLAPAFEKVAEQYADTLTIGQVNIDEEPELEDQYRVEVIPTLILFRDGQPVGNLVAPDSKAKIDELLRAQLGR